MSENGEIYTAGKNFTLPPALTAWTNSTSAWTAFAILAMFILFYRKNWDWTLLNFVAN